MIPLLSGRPRLVGQPRLFISKSVVTIGVTGKGVFPNYKIDVPGDHLDLDVVYNATAIVFSGRTHKIINDPDKIRNENWSTKSLSLSDLQNILREIRKR
jgi:hypothetical protein